MANSKKHKERLVAKDKPKVSRRAGKVETYIVKPKIKRGYSIRGAYRKKAEALQPRRRPEETPFFLHTVNATVETIADEIRAAQEECSADGHLWPLKVDAHITEDSITYQHVTCTGCSHTWWEPDRQTGMRNMLGREVARKAA